MQLYSKLGTWHSFGCQVTQTAPTLLKIKHLSAHLDIDMIMVPWQDSECCDTTKTAQEQLEECDKELWTRAHTEARNTSDM